LSTWTPRERFFHDYLTRYTNGPTLISPDFKDTEELDGLFSGMADGKYNNKSWTYQSEPGPKHETPKDNEPKDAETFAARVGKLVGGAAKQDPTMRDERCVFQILRKHFQRYTPQMVEDVC